MTESDVTALVGRLRKRCGHDSRSVYGCLDCETADCIEFRAAELANCQRVVRLNDDEWGRQLDAAIAERDALRQRLEAAEKALEKVRDRYLLAFGKGEPATGALVVELAGYAQAALADVGGE